MGICNGYEWFAIERDPLQGFVLCMNCLLFDRLHEQSHESAEEY